MPHLRVTLNGETSNVELEAASIRAGRNPDNELPLPVREASRVHFKIGKLKDGGWAVRDLGSTNGTFVNGERAEGTRRLADGDRIQLGKNCEIVFVDPAAGKAPAEKAGKVAEAPKPKKKTKKHTGPIVLKTRADRIREKQEAEKQKRAEQRKAEREKAAEQEKTQEVPEETPGDDTATIDFLDIDSEEMLGRLMHDKESADELLKKREVRFGPFTFAERLSEGGMGFVVKALHRKLKMKVALKLLRTERVDENNIARFKQEAWAISAFDHPNIVKVRDLGQHAGMYYIAMDFIDGEDLLAIGFKGSLTFWQVMEVTDKLADVLRLVHARNIWHRDIKPQNVLMDTKGEIKLIDFGIASVEREHDAATETAEGLIMGTPAFLSPEQAARGKMGEIDGRADLYSLGAVMYYLLTGRRPFTGRTAIEILANNMKKDPVHPHKVDDKIPIGLVDICLRLLRKQPDDRYQSAEDLQRALADWRKSKDGRMELDRHRKIMKLRARKAKLKKA